ncbi:Hypothetical protein D9617_4g003050 [Elsinoe fawcettii]|nr:Hypothetical protein D9617_4g003050 [Elsinoe fawcettii]
MDLLASQTTSSASWKVRPNVEQHVEYIDFKHARQLFAVDASGSTAGNIILHEHRFVKSLHRATLDKALTWGDSAGDPVSDLKSITWNGNKGGTSPSSILKNAAALSALDNSDIWYLLTDGEIWENDVPPLFRLANETGIIHIPIVFVITGRKRDSPSTLNVSVGISFFANAQNVLMLFKDDRDGQIHILAAKGCFGRLTDGTHGEAPNLETWNHIKALDSEQAFLDLCETMPIQVSTAATRPRGDGGLVNLGNQWKTENQDALVDLNTLLGPGQNLDRSDAAQLLEDEAFANLSIACKTRGRIQELRYLLSAQKIEEVQVKLEDVAGAADIVEQLGQSALDTNRRSELQHRLREAHAQNRVHYQSALKDAQESVEAQSIRAMNRAVNDALQQLAELERTTYTADILSRRSNRAKRATAVAAGGELQLSSLDLETPIAFRGECRICCGDNEVMSIALKSGADSASNTDNFALDFPLAAGCFKSNLDLISSQHVCFQCALALNGQSLYRENLAAIIPTLDYTHNNKKYIQEQLYLGLTGGLRTGASGTAQLFMAVIDGVLNEKHWAGAHGEGMEDAEIGQRRTMLQWMLQNMLPNTGCRETFNELGTWVTFPEALAWAARDFHTNGVDSWAVGYPLAGFTQLMAFGQQVGAFDATTLRGLRLAKILHGLVSSYLALLFKHGNSRDQVWKQPIYALIYANFNAPTIPTDKRGAASIVNESTEFSARLRPFLHSDTALMDQCDMSDQFALMRRAQLLAFWLLFHLPGHTRAKTFFANLRQSQPLASSILNVAQPALSDGVVMPILTSIFRATDPSDHAFFARHSGGCAFATPYGASVLRCGFPACREWFIKPDKLPAADSEWSLKWLDRVRQARAAHLVRAFGVDESFEKQAQTGMPVPLDGKAPTSIHVNLHISIARVWSRIDRNERKQACGGALDEFVALVEQEICANGRGDIFRDGVAQKIRLVMPSFLEVLQEVAAAAGVDVEDYEHDWQQNKLEMY